MRVEIITTGTELLLGEIINTNFTWLAQELNQRGFDVLYQTTVGDNPARMKEVLDIAVKRADIVITSGGLGPTRGDITKEIIAEYCNVDLYMNLEVWNHIHEMLSRRNICIATNNEKQALVPSGAIVLHNEAGTAPGLVLEHDKTIFVMLPGPPFELKTVCEKELFPYFEQRFPYLGIIKSHTLKLRGIGVEASRHRRVESGRNTGRYHCKPVKSDHRSLCKTWRYFDPADSQSVYPRGSGRFDCRHAGKSGKNCGNLRIWV